MRPSRRTLFRRAARWFFFALLAGLAAWGGHAWWTHRGPVPPTEVFRGIVYGCERLDDAADGSGLVHWVRVDLSAPGVEIYLTPVDPEAQAQGYEYKLDWAASVARREGLAVVINGTLFAAESGAVPVPGDLARALETVVADGQVNHVDPESSLLWFDDRLAPRLEDEPPPAEALARARWGVGSQLVMLRHGRVNTSAGHVRTPEARTIVGLDASKRLLWLAAFESVSGVRAAEFLARKGARDAMLLDGGSSTTMVLGPGARSVRSGTLLGGWRPVATFFGIRAPPLARG